MSFNCSARDLTHRQALVAAIEGDLNGNDDLGLLRIVSFAEKFARPNPSYLGMAFTYQAALTPEQFMARLIGSLYLIERLVRALSVAVGRSEVEVLNVVTTSARNRLPAEDQPSS